MEERFKCLRCQVPLEDLGARAFRVGGAAGVGGFLLGGFNQLSETKMTFDLQVCPDCGHVEFFARR